MNYVDSEKKPYPFCPGCTHGLVLDAIDAALEKVNADPKRTVLVSDIGCVGLADKYFNIHTFHGLHGRSFTYASGIKMANPELQVFVLVGDGGCGIGGHHLINAARRNIGIKVICFNNFNFGMTGGEHSITTPSEGITSSTPFGNIERPFDLCSLAISADATFVARKLAFDKDLSDTLSKAFKHDGFAFIDVLELCSAYYAPLNEFKKTDLEKLVKENNLKLGILKQEEQTEYSKALRSQLPKERIAQISPQGIEKKFASSLKKDSFAVVLAGSAGQKVVSAASNLARSGIASGLFASQKDDYPVTVQTGHSLSEIKLSPKPIHYPGVNHPNALIITSPDGLRVSNKVLDKLTEDDIVIVDKPLGNIDTRAKTYLIDFKEIGVSKTSMMITAITFLLNIRKIIPLEAYKSILESILKEKIRNENIKGFKGGTDLAMKIK